MSDLIIVNSASSKCGMHIWVNGWVLSCQMGGGTYSDNYDCQISDEPYRRKCGPSSTAEIAIWCDGMSNRGNMLTFDDGNTVKAYVPWVEIIDEWLPMLRKTTAPDTAKTVAELMSHADTEVCR